MRLILLTLILFPHLLFSSAKIALVTDFPPPPIKSVNPKEKLPMFYQVCEALKPQDITMEVSDLTTFNLPLRKKRGFFLKAKNRDAFDYIIFWNIPHLAKRLNLSLLPKEKMILFMWEPPTVQPHLYKKRFQDLFSKIYTWDDSLVDGKKYFKFHYPRLRPMLENLPSFEERKLCTQVIAYKKSKHPLQLYSEREKIIRFFEQKEESCFEFYGFGWDAQKHKSYKGTINGTTVDKLEVLKTYRFSICYENMQGIKGYISEKIFDCFAAGTIPIYLGASNIEEYIPKECFIDRRHFSSDESLFSFLCAVSKDDYETYLKNIRTFLDSEKGACFSTDYFIKTFQKALVH